MLDQVRIVLVGDAQCGKSSIINTINYNEFVETLPSTVEEVSIPPEYTMSQISLLLNDTASENERDLQKLMLLADVFVIVVDCSVKNCCEAVSTKWIPTIQRVNPATPIIIVANKYDLIEGEDKSTERDELENSLSKILDSFESVEVCLKCSALQRTNLDKILYYAEKSVIFPLAPLFDRSKQCLKPSVVSVLRRIFRIINRSHTLVLSDDELNEFQRFCFGTSMSTQEINNLKVLLQKHGSTNYVDSVTEGITEEGFLFLMQVFVMKDHTETVWMAMRKFNYDDSFQLTEGVSDITFEPDQSVELTTEGRMFLTTLFKMYDVHKTGVLSRENLNAIFGTIESQEPLWEKLKNEHHFFMTPGCPENCFSNEDSQLTLTGWISEWNLMVRIAPELTINMIIALGYSDDISLLYTVTRCKTYDWERYQILRRNVAHAFVFGEKAVGKSALLQKLLRSPPTSTYVPSLAVSTVVAPVKSRTQKSEEKLLIMSEVPVTCVEEVLANQMQYCDIACMMFDVNKPESFHYVTNLQKRLPAGMKVLYIANKSDLLHGPYETTPLCEEAAAFLNSYELELPLLTHKSMKDRLFPVIFDCAVYPDICVPKQEEKKQSHWLLKMSLFTVAMGLIAGGIYMFRRKHYGCLF